MRGSKYELKFDYQGKPINEDEIREVLKKESIDGAGFSSMGLIVPTQAMPRDMKQDPIPHVQKQSVKGAKKKMASEDENMNGD